MVAGQQSSAADNVHIYTEHYLQLTTEAGEIEQRGVRG
jgi:hypothetical protein